MATSTTYYEPHRIKSEKSKHYNECLENLMFTDYKFLSYQLKKIEENLTPQTKAGYYYLRLKWLIGQGENRIAKKMCPQCGKNPITHFSVRGTQSEGFSMSALYSCCENTDCQQKLRSQSEKSILLLASRFSNCQFFTYESDKDRWIAMLKQIHELEGRITGQRALEFFKEPGYQQPP